MVTSVTDVIFGLGKVLDNLNDNKNKKELDLLASRGSMSRFLSSFIVEPSIRVSNSLKTHDKIDDVINANIDMFISLYTRVFDVMLSVYGFDQRFALNILSSEKDAIFDSALESVETLITSIENIEYPLAALENKGSAKGINKVYRKVRLSSNFKDSDNKPVSVDIDVLVVANITYVDPNEVYGALDIKGERNDFFSRLDDYKAGAISLRNLILSDDLIKEYKRKRIKSKSDFLEAIDRREGSSLSKLATSKAMGFSRYYQMVIMSDSEKERIEKLVGGKLSSYRYREKAFESLASLGLSFLDDDFDMVTMYIQNIKEGMELTYKSLGSGSKDSTSEMMKWMLQQRM